MSPAAVSLEERAVTFSIGSLLAAYPVEDQPARLNTFLGIGGQAPFDGGFPGFLGQFIQPGALAELQAAYIDVFERGGRFNPLYESAYGHGQTLGKGNTLADIAGFYLAFGWQPDADGTASEMVDHVAVELEFYALLLLQEAEARARGNQEGAAVVLDARRKFLEDHLGRVGTAVALRPEVRLHPTYGATFRWLAAAVQQECARMEVTPRPLDPGAEPPEEDPTACGALNLPVLR